MRLSGNSLVGGGQAEDGPMTFRGVNPATGKALEPGFRDATEAEISRACALAAEAFDIFRESSLEVRAKFLEAIADEVTAIGPVLIERACLETGLTPARIESERARTIGQLRLFAAAVRQGEWLDIRIDPAQPARCPLPRSDIRLRNIGVGPVAVFGSSNFPLAFSVAGGDTASAFAAGCPVVVKAHPAHPGTAALVGKAVQSAVLSCGLPAGVFSLLFGAGAALGAAVVTNPDIKAVGFTGSRNGGLALAKLAAARPEPIPVHAEMSSINPVILLPAALAGRADAIARDFVGSLTLGAGQFCTNPGVLIALEGPGLEQFVQAAQAALAQVPAATMLTSGIFGAFQHSTQGLEAKAAVQRVASGQAGDGVNQGQAQLLSVAASDFIADATLRDEVFGASSLLVRCPDRDALVRVLGTLEGQLTITLQMDEADRAHARALVPLLERKAGRILVNGWPTGVEVCHAMVHGGPFPATTDSRTTSVGTLAIRRFLRPVCYQNWPQDLLPAALQDGNPFAVTRLFDGKRE